MIKHYLKIAFRNLLKHKVFSLLNITGLAIGMAGSLILLLWIENQLSVDQFHEKKDVIYKVYTKILKAGEIHTYDETPASLSPLLKPNCLKLKMRFEF